MECRTREAIHSGPWIPSTLVFMPPLDFPCAFLAQGLMTHFVLLRIDRSTLQRGERQRNCKQLRVWNKRINLTCYSRFGNPANLSPTDPDPMVMAPLVVGDYIFYTGQLIGNTFEVNSLTANGTPFSGRTSYFCILIYSFLFSWLLHYPRYQASVRCC
jgi:hypothetical protein